MLRLLPPVCRDCGKTSDQVKVDEYLDFHLCVACIAERERAVLAAVRRRPPSAKSRAEAELVSGEDERKKTGAARGKSSGGKKRATKVDKPAPKRKKAPAAKKVTVSPKAKPASTGAKKPQKR